MNEALKEFEAKIKTHVDERARLSSLYAEEEVAYGKSIRANYTSYPNVAQFYVDKAQRDYKREREELDAALQEQLESAMKVFQKKQSQEDYRSSSPAQKLKLDIEAIHDQCNFDFEETSRYLKDEKDKFTFEIRHPGLLNQRISEADEGFAAYSKALFERRDDAIHKLQQAFEAPAVTQKRINKGFALSPRPR
jgi:hypothetical protein